MIANTPSHELHEIGYRIADFYLKKNNHDYPLASKEVQSLKITDIKLENNQIKIFTARPGLLIGRKGENIFSLQNFLEKKIEIIESFSWDNILLPEDMSVWKDYE